MTYPTEYHVRPCRRPLRGTVAVPGSKSITNRALLVAALAGGESTLIRPGTGDDVEAMRRAITDLGAVVGGSGERWTVAGVDGRPLVPAGAIDAAASGTTARFVAAAAALASGPVVVDGTARMRERPIGDLVRGLEAQGVAVEYPGREGFPPVRVGPGRPAGGPVDIDPSRSSQFVSALLMVAPYGEADLDLTLTAEPVSRPYIDQTLRVMTAFGAVAEWRGARRLWVSAAHRYRAATLEVEPDASAAAYPWAAAAVCGGSVTVEGFPPDSVQADLRLLEVLTAMGCGVGRRGGAVTVTGPDVLHGVDVDMGDAPDAVVALAVAALFARGETVIRNIGSLRLKESDRIAALETELTRLGATVVVEGDRLRVVPGDLRAAAIDTYDDHRIAMAFTIAGLRVPGVVIRNPGCVAKTWPRYFEAVEGLTDHLLIAIDGPGGSGKSTVSARVASRLGIAHLETGGYYRAVTLVALQAGADPADEEAVLAALASHAVDVENGEFRIDGRPAGDLLRSPEVNAHVSAVAAMPRVRAWAVEHQRDWVARHGRRAVVEGRDIGTVVLPDADLKVFLTARPEVRAARRAADAEAIGDVSAVQADLARRDRIDSSRAVSPLRPAGDALELDTSELTIDEVVDEVVRTLSP